MAKYRTRKLCSIGGAIKPAGQVVDIDEKSAKALLSLKAIERVDGEDDVTGSFGKIDPAPAADEVKDLDADGFVDWVASGAKVGDVIDWIGEDLDRASIAEADKRPTVQKHIEKLLADDDADSDADEDTQVADDENGDA